MTLLERGIGAQRTRSCEDPASATRERDTPARKWRVMPEGRWCCKCRQWLLADHFRPNSNLRGGLDSWCRACHAQAVREWRERNAEHIAEYNARRRWEYREAHPLQTRPCIVCGGPMTKRPEELVCSGECRRMRKIEQRSVLRQAEMVAPRKELKG